MKTMITADAEGQRRASFLIGVTLCLSVCLSALEWRSSSAADTFSEADFEEMAQEIELPPAPMAPPLAEAPASAEEQHSDEIRAVEQKQDIVGELKPPRVDASDEEKLPTTRIDAIVPPVASLDAQPVDFRVVQQLPEFPGGPVQFMKWLTKNLKYPAIAQQRKRQGTVVAQFIVNEDGSVSDLRLAKDFYEPCGQEALRVLRMMPRWKAGVQDGKPCRTLFSIPIVFRL